MKRHHPLDIAIICAGPIGLTAGLLLARDGHRVLICEADAAPSGTGPDDRARPGVSQYRMPHVYLPRWYTEVASALPDLAPALLAAGARPFTLLHRQPAATTGGAQPGDEAFDTLAARRSVVETVLNRLAEQQPNLELRRPVRVTGLLSVDGDSPAVTGLRTDQGAFPADLVVDAGGRHSPVPIWVSQATGTEVRQDRSDTRVTYYCRHFESADGPPPALGPVLTHHPSWSVISLPADGARYALVLAAGAQDRAARALRTPQAWESAVRLLPAGAAWLDHGRPVGDVLVHGGADVVRRYSPAGEPLVDGLAALGDARAATMPLLGRGITLGTLDALALRDALRTAVHDRRTLGRACAAAQAERVDGLIAGTVWFARHRASELRAEAAGQSYRPDDPGWAMTVALRTGSAHDPVLARASSRLGGLLAGPADVFADPEVRTRATNYLGVAPTGPNRADLLAALATGTRTSPTLGAEPPTIQGVHHVHLGI